MNRVQIDGKGQALDGDVTTTGAICIASGTTYLSEVRRVLRQGDATTPCPECGKEGVIAEGARSFFSDGRPVTIDGAVVACGCPMGSNRVVAPITVRPAAQPVTTTAAPASLSSVSAPAPLHHQFAEGGISAPPGTLEPGFYIVTRAMSWTQLLLQLTGQQGPQIIARLQRLNPTYPNGFKAGEIVVLGDPANFTACTREEANLMATAAQVRETLAGMSTEQADFMMRHQAELAGLLGEVSLSMGVAQAMMAKGLQDLDNTLRNIELLHQREFQAHGQLKSPRFFADRKKLLQKLDAQLRLTLLNKRMELGEYKTLKNGLGLSAKSMVHHWSKAGGAGQISGYATHLDKVAMMSKYLQRGGYIGIAIGAGSSYLKVQDVCRDGQAEACKKIRFTEAGSFSSGLAGGGVGGMIGGRVGLMGCLKLGRVGALICTVAAVGAGSWGGTEAGMAGGEVLGEAIYEGLEP